MANFLRSDGADTTSGRLSIQSDDGIRLGGGNDVTMSLSSDNFTIAQTTQDKDIIFKGDDGGSAITALTLDMSDAGAATFNSTVTASGFVGDVTGDVTGNADTATTLATARTIAGQSFDGSANITIASTDLSNTSAIALLTSTQTLTNKTIDLGDNTVTGTTAEFNSALQDGSFATLAGTETLTNKTLTTPTIEEIDAVSYTHLRAHETDS